jgi:hypothetical protein
MSMAPYHVGAVRERRLAGRAHASESTPQVLLTQEFGDPLLHVGDVVRVELRDHASLSVEDVERVN